MAFKVFSVAGSITAKLIENINLKEPQGDMDQYLTDLVDIAVNLTDSAFDKDRNEVLERAQAAGVSTLIITGTTIDESREALALTQQYPGQLFCTAGVHPHYAKTFDPQSLQILRQFCTEASVKALGETGLDFNRNFSPPQQQTQAFEQQLELACETGMPLLMHERDAHERFHEMVKAYRDQISRCVLHCFTGSREELFRYLDLDLHIGLTGWICDERRGDHLRSLIKEIPNNRLMLETDAPYLLPRNLKPKPKSRRNEPHHLAHICSEAALCTGITSTQMAANTTATAKAFFDL